MEKLTVEASVSCQGEESEWQLLHVLVQADCSGKLITAILTWHRAILSFLLSPCISGLGKCTQELGVGVVCIVMNPKTPGALPQEMIWR